MSTKAPSTTGTTTGFLSFNSRPPRLYLTSPSAHAPEFTLLAWQAEGFEAIYLPFQPSQQASYLSTLKTLHKDLSLGETYAILAYGDAATAVLKTAQKPLPRCAAVVAFYPSVLPSAGFKFPSQLRVQIHVAGQQRSPRPDTCEWQLYRYEKGKIGFAEPDSNTFERVEAELAFSRALACARKAFKTEADIEGVAQAAWSAKYEDEVPERGCWGVVQGMSQNSAHVTIVPTLEGGVGRKKLEEFYREFFIPSLVEDFEIRLVSRTVGVDRVVDEMVVSFTHSDDVDWILPGVPPTNKRVEVAVVSIVAVRGGKLVSEHMYWDQASVLVQVGLLNPNVVPKHLKSKGLKKLPVVGVEGARQVLDMRQERYNGLLKENGLLKGMAALNVNGLNGV
jgi:carboxymethylenebutenolidase